MSLCVPTGSRAGAIDTCPTHAGLCGTRVQYSPPAPGPGNRGTQLCASGKEPLAHRYPDVQVLFGKSLPAHPNHTEDSLDPTAHCGPWRTFYQDCFVQPRRQDGKPWLVGERIWEKRAAPQIGSPGALPSTLLVTPQKLLHLEALLPRFH